MTATEFKRGMPKAYPAKKQRKATKHMARDWTPVQTGDVFCSPACGHQCKREWFDTAVETSRRMVEELGEPFRTRVHENLGWFSGARADLGNGITIDVSTEHDPHGSPSPTRYYSDLRTPAGGQFMQMALTATEAVLLSVMALQTRSAAMRFELEHVFENLPQRLTERKDYRDMVEKAWATATANQDAILENRLQDLTEQNATYLVDWRLVAIQAGLVNADEAT